MYLLNKLNKKNMKPEIGTIKLSIIEDRIKNLELIISDGKPTGSEYIELEVLKKLYEYNIINDLSINNAKEILLQNGYIPYFWHKQDIIDKAIEKEIELSDEQIQEVITYLENIDANVGINWDSIGIAIDEVVNK